MGKKLIGWKLKRKRLKIEKRWWKGKSRLQDNQRKKGEGRLKKYKLLYCTKTSKP